jgi:hypothetical protein
MRSTIHTHAGPRIVGATFAGAVIAVAGLVPGASQAAAQPRNAAESASLRADATVDARRPGARLGRSRSLLLRGGPPSRAYLRFRVPQLSGQVQRATLRLRTRARRAAPRIVVRSAAPARWRERTLRWRKRPRAGAIVGRSERVRAGRWTRVDVTRAVRSGGQVTLVLAAAGRGAVRLHSGEARRARDRPRLTLRTSGAGTTPQPSEPPVPPADPSCPRPYTDDSPWNRPIGTAAYDPNTASHVAELGSELTSDPGRYTYPVYEVGPDTPMQSVSVSGTFSDVYDGGRSLRRPDGAIQMPIPAGAQAAAGSDAQIVIINRATGDEWGAYRLQGGPGGWQIQNGYHYNINWSGVPPSGFGSRGAGVTYLAGLVRPCEIARGRIDHALAFAYSSPGPTFVAPATKSDGAGPAGNLPEGARLRLDPALSRADLAGMGCTGPCATIAAALQTYGMYVIDNSGSSKVMMEYEGTARWAGVVDRETVSPIPLSRFLVLDLPG